MLTCDEALHLGAIVTEVYRCQAATDRALHAMADSKVGAAEAEAYKAAAAAEWAAKDRLTAWIVEHTDDSTRPHRRLEGAGAHCERCGRVLHVNGDRTADAHRIGTAVFCEGCVSRCHEAAEGDHHCAVCRTEEELRRTEEAPTR